MSDCSAAENDALEALVGQVADEFSQRLGRGEQPSVEEYARRHPEIAGVLREVLPALQVLGLPESAPASADGPAASVPTLTGCLGDYRIIREVARGGMGIVYEAEQVSLSRRVALKILPFAGALDERRLQRFRHEAQAAAQLHHTNIVPVFGIGCERGIHFYAMQYINGQTLAAVIRELRQLAGLDEAAPPASAQALSEPASALASGRWAPAKPIPAAVAAGGPGASAPESTQARGKLSTEPSTRNPEYFRTVAHLGIQAAEGLEHAHQFGVIHRDIKPANLLVDVRGNLWVTDFGLALCKSQAGLTMTGDLVGTLRYMSPEQALAKRPLLDHRTDVYSLGVTLYELLTLEPAFPGTDREEVLRQIAFDEPRPPRRLNRAVPTELETIVLKAMAKAPEERYATAQELADDLRRFLEHKPIQAKRPSVVQRAGKWLRRNRAIALTLAGAGSILLALVFIGLLVSNRMLDQERSQTAQQRDLAEERREKAQRAEEQAKEAAAKAEAISHFLVDDLLAEAAPGKNSAGSKVTIAQVLDKAAAKMDHAFPGKPEIEAAVRLTIGMTYRSLGLNPQAEPHLWRAVELRREHLGPDHPDTLDAVNELTILLKEQGKYAEAEPLNRRNLQAYRRVLGPDHPGTLSAVNSLALLLQLEGKLQEAEPLYRQNLEAYVRVLGPDHPETLAGEHNLASVLEDLGKGTEAERLYRQSLEASVRILGPEHPDTLAGVNDLASLLKTLGKLAEAEPLLRQNLEARLRVLGPDHPNTLHAVNNLASLLKDRGKLAEAEPLYRRNLQAYHRVLGPDHPDTLGGANNLASLLYASGKLAEAEPLFRQNLEASRRVLGPNHSQTMSAVTNLAKVLRETGKLAEAEQLLRQNLEAARRTLGPGHPQTTLALSLLGWVLTDLGKPRQAEPLLRECLEIREKGSSNGGWRTADVRSLLGGCLLAQKHYPEAEPLLLQGYRELAKAPGTPSKTLDSARGRLLRLYEVWGKPDEAAAWRAQRVKPASLHSEESPRKN